MSFKELNAQIVFLEKQATSCTDEDHRKDIKESISQIYAKIKTIIANTDAEVTVKTENAGVNQNFRIIERTLASLPIFHGTDTVEAEGFINKMEQLYTLLVKEVDPSLEQDFVMLAKLKFGSNVFNQMRATDKKLDTFPKFKKFVTERFCGQYNAFQRVSKIFDIDFNDNDKYHVYATKLNEELQSSVEAIREHYYNIDSTTKLSAEMIAEFFGGLLMAQKIKIADYSIYRDMVLDFDRLTSATTVAAKAEFYRERIGNVSSSGSFWTGNHNNRNRQNRKTSQNSSNDRFPKQQAQGSQQTERSENKKYVAKKQETAQAEINDIAETFHSVLGEKSLFQ
jgi:hypothetical protein